MSILVHSRKDTASFHFWGLTERLALFVARIARAYSQRRALQELTRLDDRMLRDIGLSRGDIDAAQSLPLRCDPIALLVSQRAARNHSRAFGRDPTR